MGSQSGSGGFTAWLSCDRPKKLMQMYLTDVSGDRVHWHFT
jgi:hypothetical protein